jgi:seryl-tRNA synthetase
MIDINIIRQNPEMVKKVIASGRGNVEKANVDMWLELDIKRRDLIVQKEALNQERNQLAHLGKTNPEEAREKSKKIKESLPRIEEELRTIESKWQEILDWMPNIPFEEVPEGAGGEDNVEIKAWNPKTGYLENDKLGKENFSGRYMPLVGSNADLDFEPKPHWEIGINHDIIDIEAGAKVSGSRFYYIKKEGVLLIYAIYNLLLKKLVQEGFDPMIVPVLVREKALYGSSHFPAEADQVYKLESKYMEDEKSLYLVGSSEPSNFAYFMDTVLDLKSGPVKVMAQTPCFRTEVGSWGKDVRGIKRTHQFDKIEMNVVMEADDNKAREMHEYLLSINEWLLQQLEIPYHVINMCIGDLGYYAAAKKYDIEFWTPSQQTYTELMSDSITTDFQTRRLNIKYKDADGKLKYAYTLNDTGVTHRVLIAIIEHYQQSDGSIKVPEVLRDYVGKDFIK